MVCTIVCHMVCNVVRHMVCNVVCHMMCNVVCHGVYYSLSYGVQCSTPNSELCRQLLSNGLQLEMHYCNFNKCKAFQL